MDTYCVGGLGCIRERAEGVRGSVDGAEHAALAVDGGMGLCAEVPDRWVRQCIKTDKVGRIPIDNRRGEVVR